MPASSRAAPELRRRRGWRALPLFCLLLAMPIWALAMSTQDAVLLVFNPQLPDSVLDANGIRAALDEQGAPYVNFEHAAAGALSDAVLDAHNSVVLAHLQLNSEEVARVDGWVQRGGGLLASGQAGLGLESVLGLATLSPISRSLASEIRFSTQHPVSTGSFWNGAISQLPPMPASQIPAVVQLLYPDSRWPAYSATVGTADVLARWRVSSNSWFTSDGAAALFAHSHGAGRAVYSGALLGAYADPAWRYPLAWRTVIGEALAWVNTRGRVIQLGHWPDAHRAAFALSADAERSAMSRVVPALLAIFNRLGLQRFGTFFIVGEAGGDASTEGVREHPAVVSDLLAAGSEIGGHGDVHSRFAGQSQTVQTERLTRMRGLIEPLLAGSGEAVLGFRGPGLAVDRNTFRALAAAGMAYDSSDQDVWSEWTLPSFDGSVWHLPPSSPMDYALLHESRLSGGEWETLSRDKLDYVLSRRGMFNWVLHPWLIEAELDRVEAMLASAQQRGDLWMRRLDDLLLWWMQREDLRIELLDGGPFHLRMRLHNSGERAVNGASVWLRRPNSVEPWIATVDGQAVALVERLHGAAEAADRFEVAVVATLPAQGSVLVEWRAQRPEAVFASGFER